MFLRKVAIEFRPCLFCRRLVVPSVTRVSEVVRDKDEVVICPHNLLRSVQDLCGVGKVNVCLYFIDDSFKRLVNVVRCVHMRRVELEVCQGDLVVVCLEVIDHLQACEVTVSNVLFLE